MIEVVQETYGLTLEELEAQTAEMLPAREEMALINVGVNAAVPVNAAVGANVLSSGSTASPTATQSNNITQGIAQF